MKKHDVVIIGSGSAGSSAAIYATRYNLKTLVVSGRLPGGLITEASDVENYPGYLSISGMELANKFIDQAKSLGADFEFGEISEIKSINNHFILKGLSEDIEARAVILAMGTHHRKLGAKGEIEFAGKGVSYCATCDAPFYKGKIVIVIGGGNSAVEAAQDLAHHAELVYIAYRTDLKASPVYIDQLRKNSKIIELPKTNVLEILGEQFVTSVQLDLPYQNSHHLSVNGVFVQIGYIPSNQIATNMSLSLTVNGYVKVDQGMGTSMKGIFCAGDLNNASNMLHQQVTSAAEGAIAAQSVYRYLSSFDYIITE
jgi:thioredoxin reductase (NADPH)